jgi:putative nucleotidyltransferase with HDIG domain
MKKVNKINNNSLILIILVACLGICSLTALVSIRSWYKPSIKVDEISPVNIILDLDVEVEDSASTALKKEQARVDAIKNVSRDILTIDEKAVSESLEQLKIIIQAARDEINSRKQKLAPINPKISIESQEYFLNLSDDSFNQLILASDFSKVISNSSLWEPVGDRDLARSEIFKLTNLERKYFLEKIEIFRTQRKKSAEIKKALGRDFIDNMRQVDYESIFTKSFAVQKKLLDFGIVRGMPRSKIHERIKMLFPELTYIDRVLVEKLIDLSTLPNFQIDWEKVSALEKEAVNNVQPVKVKLKKGAQLAYKGKVVDEQNFHYLEQLKLLQAKTDWNEILNNFYLITLITLSVGFFVSFRPSRTYSVQEVVLVFLVPIVITAITAGLAVWDVNKLALAPLATISILLTVFYLPGMSALVLSAIAFFMIKSMDGNFWQILPQYIGSVYAIFLVRKAHQRQDLANAGTQVAITQVIAFLITIMIAVEDFKVSTVLIIASLYALGAIASGFIALATLPYLESWLGLLTTFKLAELSNPNQALLKRLREEAPGTYQHSLNVSRLSEEASNLLGLNTELIRVGLLYHDIGKMHAPEYFVENNLGKPNPHTTLDDPKKSAEIIIAHVAEGIKLAKKYNLPKAVADFIPMHQGTTITNYFFHKAAEKYGDRNINANDYRYPGPRPNSKETGVAMLADSTEAALRSINDLASEEKARELINRIVKARVDEGELSETGLNNNDLNKIINAFIEAWKSINHARIKYPEAKTEN